MPINTPNDEYQGRSNQWHRVRDALAGEDAVKAKSRTYLRVPEGMASADFEEYAKCASWFPATNRTWAGLTGAIFRKEPKITGLNLDDLIADATGSGTPFAVFAKASVGEVIGLGRFGILADVNSEGNPRLSGYIAERILNWRTTVVDGERVLSMVVLHEVVKRPKDDDPFVLEAVDRWRLLELVRPATGEDAVYTVSVWEKIQNAQQQEEFVAVIKPFTPLRLGKPLNFIPFVFMGPTTLTPTVEPSPILGLADLNFSHFRTTAEHENSIWYAGTPQFVIMSDLLRADESTVELRVGSGTIWNLGVDGKAEILQGAAENISALQVALDAKLKQMAVMGARLLETQKTGNPEAHETVALRHRGEDSILASLSDTCARGLSRVMGYAAWWGGATELDSVVVELNRDFLPVSMSAESVLKWITSWQQGGIGLETLFHNLRKGEAFPDGYTLKDFQKDIEDNGPAGGLLGDMSDNVPGDDDDDDDE